MKDVSSKKVLIIRFSSIGDIVLTTPVIRCLYNHGHRIDFLVKKAFRPVLESNQYLNEVLVLEETLWSTALKLRNNKYDIIIDLHKSTRSFVLRLLMGRNVTSFNKMRIKRWLRTKGVKRLTSDPHISERFLKTLNPLGISNDGKGLDFPVREKNKVELEDNPVFKTKVALIPGAQHFTKRMTENLVSKIITNHSDIFFYVLGGNEERLMGKALEQHSNVENFCGKLTLEQSASIIEKSDFVITTDTGLMHISAALNKDIIVIWGSTVPEFGFYPYHGKGEGNYISIENKDISCRPCTKSGKPHCPKGHLKCISEISTRELFFAINELSLANHY